MFVAAMHLKGDTWQWDHETFCSFKEFRKVNHVNNDSSMSEDELSTIEDQLKVLGWAVIPIHMGYAKLMALKETDKESLSKGLFNHENDEHAHNPTFPAMLTVYHSPYREGYHPDGLITNHLKDEMWQNFMRAIQPAEDIGGPEGQEYINFMQSIINECQTRIRTYKLLEKE